MNTKEDTFVTYRRRKSRYMEEFEDIQLEDTNLDKTQHVYTLTGEKEQENMRTGWSFTA